MEQLPAVLFESEDFIILNKPPGLSVHPGERKNEYTLAQWLAEKYPDVRGVGEDPARPGIVHRLDRDTSGVLIAARNQRTFLFFKEAFAGHRIEKHYKALVHGNIINSEGVICAPLIREEGKTKIAHKGTVRLVRNAETRYMVVERFGDFTLLKVIPLSGRTHQIRIHLASLGHPVVGDKKYRFKRLAALPCVKRHMLHAESMSFEMPAGHLYSFEAPIPEDFIEALQFLRNRRKSGTVDLLL